MQLLIVEDDPEILSFVQKGMDRAGYKTDSAADGKLGLEKALNGQYSAIIIDRMLPSMDGLSVIKAMRAAGVETPALILSALGQVDDKVEGLRAGGEDYLVKPFAFAELLARVEVLCRRHLTPQNGVETTLKSGDLVLDLLSRKVLRAGVSIDLQGREFRLLEYMLRNKGHLVTRTMLLENVWDYHFDPQTNVIDVHISRLRGKINRGFDHDLIKTVRGEGYMIDAT